MPTYIFRCPACIEAWEVDRPMKESSDPFYCAMCDEQCKRVYTAPQISAPVYMATDVMNAMAAGEVTAPGMTKERTRFYANGLAAQQKRDRGLKEYRGPSISVPGQTAAHPYHPAGNAD